MKQSRDKDRVRLKARKVSEPSQHWNNTKYNQALNLRLKQVSSESQRMNLKIAACQLNLKTVKRMVISRMKMVKTRRRRMRMMRMWRTKRMMKMGKMVICETR
jgi:hypothetical protein